MSGDVRVVRWMLRFGGSVLAGVVVASLLAGRHDEPGGHDQREGHVVANAQAMIPSATRLPKAGWTATATSGSPAALLDGSTGTAWESTGALPQSVTVDMRATRLASGLVHTPRPGGGRGTIGRYEVHLSLDGTTWGAPVAAGTFADDTAPKTVSFAVTGTRFVRLTALSEAGQTSAAIAELDVLGDPGAPVPMTVLDRNGWTAAASDEETAREHDVASNVLDGDPKTIWHSRYSTATPLPHHLTLDLKRPTAVGGLLYRPRAGGANGRAGEYRIAVSADGAAFTDVSSGAWPDANAVQDAVFSHVVTARYVRLTALTEAGGRGPFTSAAEISLLGPLPGAPAPLSRVGWTAGAAALLDNDLATAWRGTSFTVDTQQEQRITALVVTPAATERPGGFTVATSTDGTTFTTAASGTWADDGTPKAVALGTSARYLRVTTAKTSSAVEFHAYGPPPEPATPDPGKAGQWGATVGFPIIPVASAVLPGNKLLTWSAYAADNYGGTKGYTQTAIMDLTTGQVTQRRVDNTGHDMFCPGLSVLADGRVLVSGGSNAKQASIYDPATDAWSAAAPMTIGRGYQSQVTMATGDVFTVGGSWSGDRGGKTGEVYSPAGNSWRTLPGVPPEPFFTADPRGVFRADNHAWLFATGGGRVFHAGPSKRMHWVSTDGPGSVTDAGPRGDSADAMNGNAVMYDIGKILTLGGAPAYENSDATNRAHTIDITTGTAKVTRVGDLAFARAFATGVVLPDGTVVVIGGQARAVPFSDQTAALTPELWNPATGKFTRLAPMAVPRTYHSVANLLPDGRVFSGGGGLCGDCATNHFDGQVFTPPYLLNPDGTPKPRPAITAAPPTAAGGATLTIGTDRAVTAFALMRVGSATHTVDTDQRRVPLTPVTSSPTGYRVTVPGTSGVAPPGRYLLYALDADGVPSIGKEITIG